jgi:hypothetical protein
VGYADASIAEIARRSPDGTADYVAEHRSLHLAVIEIAFNATSADGRPLVAAMSLLAPEPSIEDIFLHGQRDREFRQDFDVEVVGGVVRLFDLGIRQ